MQIAITSTNKLGKCQQRPSTQPRSGEVSVYGFTLIYLFIPDTCTLSDIYSLAPTDHILIANSSAPELDMSTFYKVDKNVCDPRISIVIMKSGGHQVDEAK